MAATKKPGIKKAGPRSSKVVPITPREIRLAVQQIQQRPNDDVVRRIVPQTPDSLRQKLANWLESFARWVRA